MIKFTGIELDILECIVRGRKNHLLRKFQEEIIRENADQARMKQWAEEIRIEEKILVKIDEEYSGENKE